MCIRDRVKDSRQWEKHYVGSGRKVKLERKYSLSDRCRYYMPNEEVDFALNKMLDNLSKVDMPLPLISQYLPNQYRLIREGKLENNPIAVSYTHLDVYKRQMQKTLERLNFKISRYENSVVKK